MPGCEFRSSSPPLFELYWCKRSNAVHSGLQIAAASQTFLIGYGVLAAGVVIAMGMIQLCIYCITKRGRSREPKEDDAAHQLADLYAH